MVPPEVGTPRVRLGLGTAQWGMRYGVASADSPPTCAQVSEILAEAARANIVTLDTAPAYGECERILGVVDEAHAYRIVTKTPAFDEPAITADHGSRVRGSLEQSLNRLGRPSVFGLLVHRAANVLAPGGDHLIRALDDLRASGHVEHIGVSIYTADELEEVLDRFEPEIVQLPMSVCDQRLFRSEVVARLRERGIAIHVRSVFLQGLLLMPLAEVPVYFAPIRPLLARWHAAVVDRGMSLEEAALTFVRDAGIADTVLIGVNSVLQLRRCIAAWSSERSIDAREFACGDEAFVNPSNWRLR